MYAQPAMGYARYSETEMENRRRAEKAKKATRKYLKKMPEVVDVLLAIGGSEFRQRDFSEFGGLEQHEASELIKRLLSWRMITRRNKGYMVMQPALVEILRKLEDAGG